MIASPPPPTEDPSDEQSWEKWGRPIFMVIAYSIVAGIALATAAFVWSWGMKNPELALIVFLYVAAPLALLYVVVRIVRFAWTGR